MARGGKSTTQARPRVLLRVSKAHEHQSRQTKLTPNLLKPLAVELAHGVVLFAQECDAPIEWESDANIVAVELISAVGLFIT